jgi:hypothetical protein
MRRILSRKVADGVKRQYIVGAATDPQTRNDCALFCCRSLVADSFIGSLGGCDRLESGEVYASRRGVEAK